MPNAAASVWTLQRAFYEPVGMSDNVLVVIPRDPYATPDSDALEAARRAVARALRAADDVTVQVAEHPRFVDAGESFEHVVCPACGANLDGWWPDAMSLAAVDDFRDLAVVTPCCATATPLNELGYD